MRRRTGRGFDVTARGAVFKPAIAVKALAEQAAEYRNRQTVERDAMSGMDIPALATCDRTAFVGPDGLMQIREADAGARASVYAIFAPNSTLQYIGVSRDAQKSLRVHFARRPQLCGSFATFHVRKPDRALLEAVRQAWLQECGSPPGNSNREEQALWETPINVKQLMSAEEREAMASLSAAAAQSALREAVLRTEVAQVEAFEACGCQEQLLFDAKLKAKGQLDLDVAAPVGMRRPASGTAGTFRVTLKMPDGKEAVIHCPPDLTLLETAEQAGIELPSSCRSGACSACAGRVSQGVVDQSDQSYLSDNQQAAGYILTCVCYVRSDVVVETGKQAEVV